MWKSISKIETDLVNEVPERGENKIIDFFILPAFEEPTVLG